MVSLEDVVPNRGDGNSPCSSVGWEGRIIGQRLPGSCGIGWYAEAFTAGRQHGEAWGAALGVGKRKRKGIRE